MHIIICTINDNVQAIFAVHAQVSIELTKDSMHECCKHLNLKTNSYLSEEVRARLSLFSPSTCLIFSFFSCSCAAASPSHPHSPSAAICKYSVIVSNNGTSTMYFPKRRCTPLLLATTSTSDRGLVCGCNLHSFFIFFSFFVGAGRGARFSFLVLFVHLTYLITSLGT